MTRACPSADPPGEAERPQAVRPPSVQPLHQPQARHWGRAAAFPAANAAGGQTSRLLGYSCCPTTTDFCGWASITERGHPTCILFCMSNKRTVLLASAIVCWSCLVLWGSALIAFARSCRHHKTFLGSGFCRLISPVSTGKGLFQGPELIYGRQMGSKFPILPVE
jgi:hypothetical protein